MSEATYQCVTVLPLSLLRHPRVKPVIVSFVLRHYHYGLEGRNRRYSPVHPGGPCSVTGASATAMKASSDHQSAGRLLTYDELDSGLSGSKTLSHEFFQWDGREITKSGGCSCSLTLSKHWSHCNRDDFENSRYTALVVTGNPSDNSNRETWKKRKKSPSEWAMCRDQLRFGSLSRWIVMFGWSSPFGMIISIWEA